MKYIRTKEHIYKRLFIDRAIINECGYGTCDKELNPIGETIIKQADTIEELIQSGDLVEFKVQIFLSPLVAQVKVHKVSYIINGIELSIPGVAFGTRNVKTLWIQTPNGDFHKVAEKKSEEGELELL